MAAAATPRRVAQPKVERELAKLRMTENDEWLSEGVRDRQSANYREALSLFALSFTCAARIEHRLAPAERTRRELRSRSALEALRAERMCACKLDGVDKLVYADGAFCEGGAWQRLRQGGVGLRLNVFGTEGRKVCLGKGAGGNRGHGG